MLASIVPGLREIRAPLAAGYLWILAAWLALHDELPQESDASGVYAALFDLKDAVSAVGIAIVLSAAAYLVGVISEGILGPLWRGQLGFGGFFYAAPYGHRGDRALEELARRRADEIGERLGQMELRLADLVGAAPTGAATAELATLLHDAKAGRGNAIPSDGADPEADARADLASALRGRIAGELDLLRTRLLGNEQDLFSAIDRMRSEAEMRFAVAAPLIAVILVFAVRDSLWWLFALAAVVVVWRQARERLQESGDMLVDSLLVGRVNAPTLERLEQDLVRLDAIGGHEARQRALIGASE